jgi:hypothetical protein
MERGIRAALYGVVPMRNLGNPSYAWIQLGESETTKDTKFHEGNPKHAHLAASLVMTSVDLACSRT